MKGKKIEISFMPIRSKGLAYAENGNIRTYANITQAENKLAQLQAQGHQVHRTASWPFLIIKSN